MNEGYEPNANEEAVIELLKGEPGGRVNPLRVRVQTDLDKGEVEYALSNLTTAGWVKRVNEGLYEFVGDPRC